MNERRQREDRRSHQRPLQWLLEVVVVTAFVVVAITLGTLRGLFRGVKKTAECLEETLAVECRIPNWRRKAFLGLLASGLGIWLWLHKTPRQPARPTENKKESVGQASGQRWEEKQAQWLALYTSKRPNLKPEEALSAVDPFIGWMAERLDWDVQLLRALALLESGGNQFAINPQGTHVGYLQMSVGNVVRYGGLDANAQKAMVRLQQEWRKACYWSRANRVTNKTFDIQRKQYLTLEPRTNRALLAWGAVGYLRGMETILGDPVLAIQAYHNGLGNLVKLMRVYGEYTGDYSLEYSPESSRDIERVAREAVAEGFSYRKFWELYNGDPKFHQEVALVGLQDNAETYAFKVLALSRWLKTQSPKPAKALSDEEMLELVKVGKAKASYLVAFFKQPKWFSQDLPRQRRAVALEKRKLKGKPQLVSWRTVEKWRAKGWLCPVRTLPDIGLYIDRDMGRISGHAELYKSANPRVWRVLKSLAADWKKRGGGDIYTTSLVRSRSYQARMGNVNVGHACARATDIALERQRPCWRWAQGEEFFEFLLSQRKKRGFSFYTEQGRDHIHLFLLE